MSNTIPNLGKIEWFPQSLVKLQLELFNPAHRGLLVQLQTTYGDDYNPHDILGTLVQIATLAKIELDGDYTIDELAALVLKGVLLERRMQVYNNIHIH